MDDQTFDRPWPCSSKATFKLACLELEYDPALLHLWFTSQDCGIPAALSPHILYTILDGRLGDFNLLFNIGILTNP